MIEEESINRIEKKLERENAILKRENAILSAILRQILEKKNAKRI